MAWKKVPGFGKNKKDEVDENNSMEIGSQDNHIVDEETFELEEESTTDDINPRNRDLKEKNKKLILFSGIGLIFFSIFVYFASSSRKVDTVKKHDEELIMKSPQEEDDVKEITGISSLKREIEEVKTGKNNNSEYKKLPASTVPEPRKQEMKKSSNNLYPPLPPPNDNPQEMIERNPDNKTFPTSFPYAKNEEKQAPVKYKLVIIDVPFQSASFVSSRGAIVRTSVLNVRSNGNPASTKIEKDRYRDELINSETSNEKEKPKDAKSEEPKSVGLKTQKTKSKTFTIPAGSFFKVILLNGVDAPTGMGGKASPYPVIGRVLTDSVLPNRFFADMKGCFVLGDATGELASERVIMRFTKISCVTVTGKVIEKNLTAFIAGEDGKYGLIGRVVSKAGAQLGRVLLAKFVESAGNILTLQSQIVSTSGIGTVSTIDPDKAGQSAVFSGFAGAAKTLSEYYLKLADQIFPVIEINAGRQGDVVLLKNLTINLDSDLKDNGGFIQRNGILSNSDNPESKVFKIREENPK